MQDIKKRKNQVPGTRIKGSKGKK